MKMKITVSVLQLQAALACSVAHAELYVSPLNSAMERFEINTTTRVCAFLAQVGHESGRLARTSENLNYSAEGLLATFPSHFVADEATAYAHQPERIADHIYANRMGNGDEASGEGWKHRGYGLIQITGKANQAECGVELGLPLESSPELLEQPDNAALSAAWFWNKHGCNALADAGEFAAITKRINGGLIGQADREALW